MVASHVRASPLGSPNNPVDPAHFAKVLDVFFETHDGTPLHPDDKAYFVDRTAFISVSRANDRFVYRTGRTDRYSDKDVITLVVRHSSYAELQEACLTHGLMDEEDAKWTPLSNGFHTGPVILLALLLTPPKVRRTVEALAEEVNREIHNRTMQAWASLGIKSPPVFKNTSLRTVRWSIAQKSHPLHATLAQYQAARSMTRWGFLPEMFSPDEGSVNLSLLLPTFVRLH